MASAMLSPKVLVLGRLGSYNVYILGGGEVCACVCTRACVCLVTLTALGLNFLICTDHLVRTV